MLKTRVDRWRAAFVGSVGLWALGCVAKTGDSTVVSGGEADGPPGDGATPPAGEGGVGAAPPPAGPPACEHPTAVLDEGVSTGLERCENGVVHRPRVVECPNHLAARSTDPIAPDCGEDCGLQNCSRDSDCTDGLYGRCVTLPAIPIVYPGCLYGCTTDADCESDEFCVCGPEIGRCEKASCRSSEGCDDSLLCAAWVHRTGIGCGERAQYACQSAGDECALESDCPAGDHCSALGGSRHCETTPSIACGRPFVVAGQARLAPLAEDGGYRSELGLPGVDGLDAAHRERIAAAWAEIGRMEHASIAAFGRFSLQLLSLGSPARLLEACHRALADETEHARLAFSLASHFAGRDVGPGPLSLAGVDGALDGVSLAEVVALVVREGCVGETIAALEASEALAHCEHEAERRAWTVIARDERDHAALAWRFVDWALARDPSLERVVREALAGELARPAESSGADDEALLERGLLGDARRATIRRAALREVVAPCARALLEARGAVRDGSPSTPRERPPAWTLG